jgi:hypothetical protein
MFLTSPSVPIQCNELYTALHDTHGPLAYRSNRGGASSPLCTYLHLGELLFYNRSQHILRGNFESIKEPLADVI